MNEGLVHLMAALGKALRDLLSPGLLWRALWPSLLSALLCLTLAVGQWQAGTALMARLVPVLPWSGWEWLSQWAAAVLFLAALFGLFYTLALALMALLVLPGLLEWLARRDYADLARHGQNSFIGALGNTLIASLLYGVALLLSLPLLLIPGVILVLPLLLNAWLNARTFQFDVLAEHATVAERRQLIRGGRREFFAAGLAGALFAMVPLANLLAPFFTALLFVHLGLQRLRALRRQQGIEL